MTNEELQQKVKRLEEELTEVRIALLESKADKQPYKVEVPENLEDYFHVDETGIIYKLSVYVESEQIKILNRGLAFKTEEEVKQYDRERILLFKLHKWAEEHNGGWTPNWNDEQERKYTIDYNAYLKKLASPYCIYLKPLSKLPYFKSEELAELFIEEFGDEIVEVLC